MNFLKKYSKLSRISYTSIRTFAYNAKPYNAPIGSGTINTAPGTTNAGIGIRSASPSDNSSISRGASGRNPEHITSTDTRFNSFNASGPTSDFQGSDSQDLASSAKGFADSTASSLKNLADQAANTAKGFVDQAQGMSSRGDSSMNRNRSRSPIDDLVDTASSVAQGFGNLAQGAVSAATSFGSNFIPQGSQNQNVSDRSQRPAYYDEHDYNRDNAIRNTGRYGSQDSRYTSYDPVQDIGKFVDSTATNIRDATNEAANRARGTFDQMTGNTFSSASQADSSSSNSNMINSTLSQAQAIAETAANLAGYAVKGMMDNAAYLASAFAPSSTSSTTAYPHTERSAAFNSQQTSDYGYVYNPGYTGTENKRVEHITSTDTRFNAFRSAGHVSGFGAPWARNLSYDEFSSDAKRFADNAASNIKGAVDQAADTAKDFVDRGSSYMNSTGNPAVDLMNQAASTAQAIVGQTAYIIGSTLNNLVIVASSVAYSLNPSQQQQTQNTEMYHQDQNYINNNYGERRPQNFTSTDTRSNFFNPGQASGDHPISPFDNPIGNLVSSFTQGNPITSMIQGAVNTGFNLASNFVPRSQSQSQNPNFFRQNQYSSSEDRSNRNLAAETVDNAVKGAADVAQGLANAANNIASAFIPGGNQNRNPSQR